MDRPSLPDPAPLVRHLALVGSRPAATGCFVCRQAFTPGEDDGPPPGCERCGLEPLYHLHCYVDGLALAPAEAAFWGAEEAGPGSTIFLCAGCRS